MSMDAAPNERGRLTRPRRLGMIVPSSNTTIEAELPHLLPAGGSVTVHTVRVRVVQLSGDPSSDAQFEHAALVEAAGLLADAEVDLILWNGTSASWLGRAWDASLIADINRRTGVRTTTAIFAIDLELARLGVRRLGLVTPYTRAIEERIMSNYAARGIEIAAAARLDLTRNTDFALVPPDTVADMVRTVAAAKPDAIVILCTNLAGARIAPALSAELGLPVIDSVATAVRHSLDALGI
jgi:maleate isomerase